MESLNYSSDFDSFQKFSCIIVYLSFALSLKNLSEKQFENMVFSFISYDRRVQCRNEFFPILDPGSSSNRDSEEDGRIRRFVFIYDSKIYFKVLC